MTQSMHWLWDGAAEMHAQTYVRHSVLIAGLYADLLHVASSCMPAMQWDWQI